MITVFRAGWTESSALRLGVLAMPLLAFGTAILLSGNGFIAAFVAGICFGTATRRLPADALHLTEDAGTMLSLIVWFIFGSLVNDALAIRRAVGCRALRRRRLDRRPHGAGDGLAAGQRSVDPGRVRAGLVGARGLASIVFGLLAYIGLSSPQNDTVADVMVATVALSVVLPRPDRRADRRLVRPAGATTMRYR